jgi:hypothetical protein
MLCAPLKNTQPVPRIVSSYRAPCFGLKFFGLGQPERFTASTFCNFQLTMTNYEVVLLGPF